MVDITQVTTAIFDARLRDNISAGAEAAQRALQDLAGGVEVVEERVTRHGKSVEQLVRKYDPASKAASDLARAQRDLANSVQAYEAGVATGRVSAEQATAALSAQVAMVERLRDRYQALQQAQASAADTPVQARINAAVGVQAPTSDERYAERARDIAAYSAQLDALQAKYAPLTAAQVTYRRELEAIAEAQRRGAITTADMYRAQDQAAANYNRATTEISRFGRATGEAQVTAGRFGNILAQGGLQLQDFIVQAQAGTSIFVALGQQGSQFLSAFGTGGAIAGAVLALGAFVAQMLSLKTAGEDTAKSLEANFSAVREGQQALAKAVQDVNDLFLTQAQRAQAAAAAARQATAATLERQEYGAIQRNEGNAVELGQAQGELARLNRLRQQEEALRERQRRAGVDVAVEGSIPTDRIRELENRIAGLNADTERTTTRLGQIQETRRRLAEAPPPEREEQVTALTSAAKQVEDQQRIAEARKRGKTAAAEMEAQIKAETDAVRLNLTGWEREQYVQLSVAAARQKGANAATESVGALTKAANTAENYAEGLRAAARAAEQGYASFLRAAAAADAHKQAANGARGSEEALTEAILRRNAAQEGQRATERNFALQQEAATLQRRLDASGLPAEARRTVEIDIKADEATAKLRGFAEALRQVGRGEEAAGLDAVADRMRGLVEVTERGNDALKVRQALTAARENLSALEEESRLVGLTAGERERELAALRESRRIRELGGSGPDQEEAAGIARRRTAFEQANRFYETSWNELSQVGVRAFDRVGQAITNALVSGQLRWKDFGNVAKGVLSEIIQAVLRLAVINPIANWLSGSNASPTLFAALSGSPAGAAATGGDTGLTGYLGYGSSALGLARQGYSMFGGGGISGAYSSAMNYPIDSLWGANSVAIPANQVGLSGDALYDTVRNTPASYQTAGLTPASFLGSQAYSGIGGAPVTYGAAIGGAAGLAGGAYGIYSGVQKGGVGGGFQVAGGAASSALGAAALAGLAVPVYGWIAAAVLAILGAVLPGQKPSNREGTAILDLATDALKITGQEGEKFSQANRDMAASVASGIGGIITKAEGLLNFRANQTIEIGVGDRDGIAFRYQGEDHRYQRTDADVEKLTRDVVQRVVLDSAGGMAEAVRAAVGGVDWSDLKSAFGQLAQIAEVTNRGATTPNQDIAARRLDFAGDFQGSIASLKWVKEVYEPAVGSELESSFAKQRRAIDDQWDAMIKQAEALGLETGVLADKHGKAVRKLFTDTADAVGDVFQTLDNRRRAALGEAPDSAGQALRSFDRNAAKEVEALKKQIDELGGTSHDVRYAVEALVAAQSAERDALIEQAQRERNGIREGLYLRDLRSRGLTGQASLTEFDLKARDELEETQKRIQAAGGSLLEQALTNAKLGQIQFQERGQLEAQVGSQGDSSQFRALEDRLYGIETRRLRTTSSPYDAGLADLRQFDREAMREVEDLRAEMQRLGRGSDEIEGRITELSAVHWAERERVAREAQRRIEDVETGLWAARENLVVRRARAAGTPSEQVDADLRAFDAQAQQERIALRRQLEDAGWEAAGVLGELEWTLAKERERIARDGARRLEDVERGLWERQADIGIRRARLTGRPEDALRADLDAFAVQSSREWQDLKRQFEDAGRSASETEAALTDLSALHWAERERIARDGQRRIEDVERQVADQRGSIAVRGMRAAGRALEADLAAFDQQASGEVVQLRRAFEDMGRSADETAQAVSDLTSVQVQERARIRTQAENAFADLNEDVELRNRRALANLVSADDTRGQIAASQAADLAEFDARARREVRSTQDQLVALGRDQATVTSRIADLEETLANERLVIQKRYVDQALAEEKRRNDTAKGLLEQLAIGDLGGLAPETRYFAGMQSLNAARQALDPTDTASLQEYVRVAQQILPVAKEFLGPSERYGALVSDVAATLRNAAPGGDVANLATLIRAQTTGSDAMTDAILSTSGVTNDLLARIQADISRLNANMTAVMTRMAQAA